METMFVDISFISSKGRNVHSHWKGIQCGQPPQPGWFGAENSHLQLESFYGTTGPLSFTV